MKGASILYSHKSDEHITDPKIIDRLEKTFGIAFDPCPSPNYLHRQFQFYTCYDDDEDGETKGTVTLDWTLWPGVPTFINPPYSDIDNWVDAAIAKSREYPLNSIVMLLPARTDRPWFEKLFKEARAIGFIRGRLRFLLADPERKGTLMRSKWQAPFPSMLVVLENTISMSRNVEILQCLEELNAVALILKNIGPNEQ